jgi:hypothetical protein
MHHQLPQAALTFCPEGSSFGLGPSLEIGFSKKPDLLADAAQALL